jgi:hypothetical protein
LLVGFVLHMVNAKMLHVIIISFKPVFIIFKLFYLVVNLHYAHLVLSI